MLPSHLIEAIFTSRGGQSTSAPKPRSARENGSKAGDLGGIGTCAECDCSQQSVPWLRYQSVPAHKLDLTVR